MATYLTYQKFRNLAVIPEAFIDDVEKTSPGWVANQLEYWARWLDARLRKRYASPFAAHDATPPTPATVQGWLARIVTVRVWLKRGVDPDDLQYVTIAQDAENAFAEVLEAANSDEGWFDLPLRTDANGSAITQGNPRAYSEQSPYVWTDRQRATGVNEDDAGGGSSV